MLDSRTDVWSAGCLLFAWYYGYSPYECEFTEEDGKGLYAGRRAHLRVVECSHSRVLSAVPRRAESAAISDDQVLSREVDGVLRQNMTERPFLTDVIVRLRAVMGALQTGQEGTDYL